MWCTSIHPIKVLANRSSDPLLWFFSRPRNAEPHDYSTFFKSSWHARLKEHKAVWAHITGDPWGENLELIYPPRVYCMCGWILDEYCRKVANEKSQAHKSWAGWLVPQLAVGWGSLQHYWCFPSCTWCLNEIFAEMVIKQSFSWNRNYNYKTTG